MSPILADLGAKTQYRQNPSGTGALGTLRLPGTAGNYVSTPDSVLNSITGDFDIRVKLSLTTWLPAAIQSVLVKRDYGTGANGAYGLRIDSAGGINGVIWTAPSSVLINNSTSAVPFAAGATGWIRMTFKADNGAGQNVCSYYSSTDGITWTLLGAPAVNAGVVQVLDTGAPILIGGGQTGQDVNGTVYYAEVRNGIDGPIVAKFDASTIQVSGAQSPATISGWTLNGSALYRRDDYVRLPGTAGNYLTWPNAPSVQITGDIELVWYGSLDNWGSGTVRDLISKFTSAGNQRGYMLSVNASNQLTFFWSNNGTASNSVFGNAVSGVTGYKWIKVTFAVATGQANFYTSDDGTTWTAAGTPAASGATSIFGTNTALLQISGKGDDIEHFAGTTKYAAVKNGINGTVVASFDARDIATPWTVNGSGWNWQGANVPARPSMALSLSGVPANTDYAATPDSSANSITGDIDIRVKAALTNWVPAARNTLVSKYLGSGTNRSFWMAVNTGGNLEFLMSTDGTATFSGQSTALGLATGATKWLRATRVQSSGLTSFYVSDDGEMWTPLGTATIQAAAAINDGTASLTIGARSEGSIDNVAGKIFYAEVRNGIDGPIVAEFHPSRVAKIGTRLPTTMVTPGGSPNLLTPNQASIETDATGWAAATNAPTIARDTSQFLDGAASLSITATVATTATSVKAQPSTTVPVVPGKMYTAKANWKVDAAVASPQAARIAINWRDAAGAIITSTTGSNTATLSSASWTEATVSGVAPTLAVTAGLEPTIGGTPAIGDKYYMDRVSIVETPATWTVNGAAWDWVAA